MNYYRRVIYCNKKIFNSFKFENAFQVYPNNEKKDNKGDYYPITLEYDFKFLLSKTSYIRVERFQEEEALVHSIYHDAFVREIIELLTLNSSGVFFIRNTDTPRNTYPETSEPISTFSTLSLLDETKNDDNSFLSNISSVISSFYDIPKTDYLTFKTSVHWYYLSQQIDLELLDYDIRFISLVNCIEALIKIEDNSEPEVCNDCGNLKFKVVKKYINFLIEYSGSSESKTKQRKLYSKLYNKRSNLVHNGDFFLPHMERFINISNIEELYLIEDLQKVTHKALVNFILRRPKL